MNISGTYGGNSSYVSATWTVMPITVTGSGTNPAYPNLEKFPTIIYPTPSPTPPPGYDPDPVGSTSPRIRQTVLPIKFGENNSAGYDGYWIYGNNDLPGNGLLGLNRTWSNKPGLASGAVGTGSTISDLPRLTQGSNNLIQLIVNSAKAYEFDQAGSNYYPRFRQPFKVYSPGGGELVVATDSGRVFTFFDFSSGVAASQKGTFKSMLDEGGNLTSVSTWDSSGRPTEVTTVNVTTSPSVTESVVYTYSTTSPNVGMLSTATLRRKVGTGSYSTVLTVYYTYHDGTSTTNGIANDLKTVEIKNANNQTIDYQYYRYYTSSTSTGYAHGLKYGLGYESYKRIYNDLGDPDTKTDSQLAPYADHYFEYTTNNRISKHTFAGEGNSGSGGGLGTYTYSYATTTSSNQGFNLWKSVMIETNPEGATTTTYTNAAGQVLLSLFNDGGSPAKEWAKYNHYDAYGAIDMQAEPSAIESSNIIAKYKSTWGDLVNFGSQGNATALKDSSGLFTVYTYGATTIATTSSAGMAAGYLSCVSIKRGETNNIINKTAGYDYYNHVGNNVDTFILANTYSYPIEASQSYLTQVPLTTSYAYDSWHTYTYGSFGSIDSAQPKSVTVTLPTVTTSQNGSGSSGATMTSVYDVYGRTIWAKDAGSILAYTQYDSATMVAVKSILDVNTSVTADFSNLPASWSTISGAGLHLKSTSEVDVYGRRTMVTDANGNTTYTVYKDATQEIRIYSGWNASSHTTAGPIILLRGDFANGYSESLTYSATPDYSANGPTGTEAVSGVVSLARTYTNLGGQTTAVDSYFDLSGLTYSTAINLGTEGANYLRVRYAYDDAGRQNRTQSPSGTISRIVYDRMGRPISSWVGLDDTPTSGSWSPTNTSGTDLVKVAEGQYDDGGVGDSNLTQVTEIPGGGAANRVSKIWYDARNRVSAVKSGVESTESSSVNRTLVKYLYDNWDNIIAISTFDMDGYEPSLNVVGGWYPGYAAVMTSYVAAAYDNLGQLYKTTDYNIFPGSGLSSTSLTTNYWYDSRGNLIKTAAPGGLVEKYIYDGIGRVKTSYLTDGGGDSGYSDASSVTGDIVLTQDEFAYDANSNVIMSTSRERFHNASGTGALNSSTSRAYYATAYYDVLGRLTTSIDVGTNGASSYSRPSSSTDSSLGRSDIVLRTDYQYSNTTGLLEKIIDPRDIQSKFFYDAMGRTTKTIEAFDGGSITATTNKTTEFGYDSYGRMSTVKAYRSSSDYSQTQYIYGVTTSSSAINSNDVLSSVRYPDKTTGNASSSIAESYTVNALGEVVTATDRLGTTHTYARDVLGRLTSDSITTLGSGVDGTVKRIETAYNSQGIPYLFTSYSAASGGTVKNRVQDEFNGFGQLIKEYQSHNADSITSSTLYVGYSYVEGGTTSSPVNNSRQTGMVYPNGRTLTYDYGSSGGTNDKISRLAAIKDGSTTLESYQYLGLSQAVVRSHPQPSVDLTYVVQSSDFPVTTGEAGDQYIGLDRFGRVIDQRWINTNDSTKKQDRFQYGYDRNGNVLYKNNVILPARSELYHVNGSSNGYDNLNQLTAFARGNLDTLDTISTPTQSQSFTPDGQGNFTSITTNGTSVTRTYDKQNELTGIGSVSLTYDAAGNIKTDELNRTYTYDAWNRLISVSAVPGDSNSASMVYTYDALGRRITETRTLSSTSEERHLYYSADWQVIEERLPNTANPPVLIPHVQYVWSPIYVDAMIERDVDANGDGTWEQRLYVLTDANFNVTALVNLSGDVVERYLYDPYGNVTILVPTPGVGDDWSTSTTGSNYGWQYLHQGGRQDKETGLLNFRNRDYSTSLMRWTTNDPIGFGGGDTNTYRYEGNSPGNALDPSGLAVGKGNGWVPPQPPIGDGKITNPWVVKYPDKNTMKRLKNKDLLTPSNPEWWKTMWKETGADGAWKTVRKIGQYTSPITGVDPTAAVDEAAGRFFQSYEAVWSTNNGDTTDALISAALFTVADTLGSTDLTEAVTGKELFTNRELSRWEVAGKYGTTALKGTAAVFAVLGAKGFMRSCFPAGTPVATSQGLQAIERVKNGEEVWAFDVIFNKWSLKKVIQRFETDYQGDAVILKTDTDEILPTAFHPIWVIRGQDLDLRPRREHLASIPSDSRTMGRWVDACDLMIGDELLKLEGGISKVLSIELIPLNQKVYNFEIEDLHTYAVGLSSVLVHNANMGGDVTPNWNNGWRTPNGKFASPLGPGQAGSAAEMAVWDAVAAKPGWQVIRGRVSARDAAGRMRVYDGAAISPRGRVIGLEVKSGSGKYRGGQRPFDSALNSSRENTVTGIGGNADLIIERAIGIRR